RVLRRRRAAARVHTVGRQPADRRARTARRTAPGGPFEVRRAAPPDPRGPPPPGARGDDHVGGLRGGSRPRREPQGTLPETGRSTVGRGCAVAGRAATVPPELPGGEHRVPRARVVGRARRARRPRGARRRVRGTPGGGG